MRYKIIVYILFILFALSLICIGHLSHAQGRPGSLYTATVLRIIDGDTIHVRDMAGTPHRIRLAMIDAPEKAQPYGEEAAKKLSELLHTGIVRLKVKCIDKYNREVAFVYCEGKDVSAEMLKEGMALHYHMKFDDCELYDRIQAQIQQDKKGLWAQNKVEKPWEYRRMNNTRETK